jgi:plastocyanin
MRRTTLTTIGVLVLLAIVGIAYAFFRPGINTGDSPTGNNTAPPPPSTSGNDSAPNPPDTSQSTTAGTIYIKDNIFSPPQITIPKGSAVSWVNNDEIAHTVTIDQGDGPHSGEIAAGVTYSYTFNTAGSFQYHCDIHRSMRGTIVVQ